MADTLTGWGAHIIATHYQRDKTVMTCTCGWRYEFPDLDPPIAEINRRAGLHSYRGPMAGSGRARRVRFTRAGYLRGGAGC